MIPVCKILTTSGRSLCARKQKSHKNAVDDPQKSLATPLLLLRLLCPWLPPLGSSKLVRPSVDARPDLVSHSPIRPDLVHERSKEPHSYLCLQAYYYINLSYFLTSAEDCEPGPKSVLKYDIIVEVVQFLSEACCS